MATTSIKLFPGAAIAAGLLSLVLAACGGAPADAAINPSTKAVIDARSDATPRPTGDAATDGLNWINYRRHEAGLTILTRNPRLDSAALGQSNYLQSNKTITHVQSVGQPGFTGVTLTDRLAASGYGFKHDGQAYGEVIASTSSRSGFNAADQLVTAIYHRFVVLEPMSKQAGAAVSSDADGIYFTADTAADGLDQGLGIGKFITYPAPNQNLVPTLFHSAGEKPDPVPNRREVGFPVSIHADLLSIVQVQRFSLRPRGGAPIPVQLLTNASDPNTPTSAAAIIPLDVLTASTTYDVQFVGRVDGQPVSRSWQFSTQ
ncbi:MAG TPA: CAP domain-containing protein [Burkholderiaceae bacterium]|jgi:uncharacterized protein YkwD